MTAQLACYLTTNDHAILQEILDLDPRDNAYSRLLRSKLLQAAICPPCRVPDDAVTIGSRVTFCVNAGAARTAYVVRNESRDFPVYTISVKSILGLGILGLRAGGTINIETDIGRPQKINVLRLDFQAPAPRLWLVNAVTSAFPRRVMNLAQAPQEGN
ncbi:hypothetical protein ELI43_37290 [Rhizobium leguminosarum]|uniref:GreA/GreB family elongation factor n=1 Tax=Rhizobium leguminosarum TaxID=384 RepID=UPI00103212BC|nr:GreA/GreB family elongation factor [Rhizobium leguminosarum]TAU35251.1 hypothetical protein ELI43_37290 [Rhizobium leguminosarum]